MYLYKNGTCLMVLLLASMKLFAMPIPPQWKIDPKTSTCTFTATQNNAPVSGEFKDIQGEITFSPEKLDESYAKISINMNSVSTSYTELTDILKTSDWLNIKLFPTATFTSTKFIKEDDKKYNVEGTLSIRNKTIPVTLPFTIDEHSKDKLQIHGSTTLNRTQFEIGQGEWADTREVKDSVKIDYKLGLSPL